MPAVLFWLLALSCGGSPPDAPSPTTSAPVAPSPATPDAAPTQEAAPGTATKAPFRIEEERSAAGPQDRFVFWGWSADSRYYAYETYYPGGGGASCDMRGALVVVDADKDAYAPDGRLSFAWDSPGGPCKGTDPREALDAARAAHLDRFGIQSEGTRAPVLNTESSTSWLVESPDSPWFSLEIALTGQDTPDALGYRLEMNEVGHAGLPQIIEKGTRLRSWVQDYGLAMVFVAPDSSHVAIVISMKKRDFEGSNQTWMTNGSTILHTELGEPDEDL